MDAISQIQHYTVTVAKLMSQSIDSLQSQALSPAQAQALQDALRQLDASSTPNATSTTPTTSTTTSTIASATTASTGAAASAPPTTLSGPLAKSTEAWVESVRETSKTAQEIFTRIAQNDVLMSSLPAQFASEEKQLRELAALKIMYEQAEARLILAERDAVHCQKALKDVIRTTGAEIIPIQVEEVRDARDVEASSRSVADNAIDTVVASR